MWYWYIDDSKNPFLNIFGLYDPHLFILCHNMLDQLIHYPSPPPHTPHTPGRFRLIFSCPCSARHPERQSWYYSSHHTPLSRLTTAELFFSMKTEITCWTTARLHNVIQKYTSDIFPSWYIQKCQIMQDWLYIILPARYLLENYTANTAFCLSDNNNYN